MPAHPIELLFGGPPADAAEGGARATPGVLMMDGAWRPFAPVRLEVAPPSTRLPLMLAIPLRSGRGGLADLLSCATLPLRVRRCERALTRIGCHVTRFAVEPSLAAPTLVFELGSIAEDYARTHLLGHSRRWPLVRRALAWWMGCDPSVGGILLIGRRS